MRRAISPIIATLILVIVAIGASVSVYAYVAGWITNSSVNQPTTQNSIDIQFVSLASSSVKVPITAFVQNQGPGTEYFNGGFYLVTTGSSVSLGVGMSVTESGSGAVNIKEIVLQEVSGNPTEAQAVITFASSCPATVTITIAVFGATTSGTCTASTTLTTSASGALNGISLSTSPQFKADTGLMSTGFLPSSTASIVGAPITQGTLSISVNGIGELTLAPDAGSATPASNPLTSGSTYTITVVGTDGSSDSTNSVSS